jgi:hypothetical protein
VGSSTPGKGGDHPGKGGGTPGKGSLEASPGAAGRRGEDGAGGANGANGTDGTGGARSVAPVSQEAFLASHRRSLGPAPGDGRSYCEACRRLEIRRDWLARSACSVCRRPLGTQPQHVH